MSDLREEGSAGARRVCVRKKGRGTPSPWCRGTGLGHRILGQSVTAYGKHPGSLPHKPWQHQCTLTLWSSMNRKGGWARKPARVWVCLSHVCKLCDEGKGAAALMSMSVCLLLLLLHSQLNKKTLKTKQNVKLNQNLNWLNSLFGLLSQLQRTHWKRTRATARRDFCPVTAPLVGISVQTGKHRGTLCQNILFHSRADSKGIFSWMLSRYRQQDWGHDIPKCSSCTLLLFMSWHCVHTHTHTHKWTNALQVFANSTNLWCDVKPWGDGGY